jgi:hypothetical protein
MTLEPALLKDVLSVISKDVAEVAVYNKIATRSEGRVSEAERSNPRGWFLELHSPRPATCPRTEKPFAVTFESEVFLKTKLLS